LFFAYDSRTLPQMKAIAFLLVAFALMFTATLRCFAQEEGFTAAAPPILVAGVPSDGTSEVQTLTIGGTPTAGTFTITFDGFTTGAITWTATDATLITNIQTALNALPNLEDGEVTVADTTMTSGIGAATLTFAGNRAKLAVNLMVATSSLTGTSPTAVITETTAGVTASGRGAAKGRLLINTSAGTLYQNTGTGLSPTWTAR
jgi:hypothetical protein